MHALLLVCRRSGLEDVDSAFCPSCASRRHSSDSGGNRAQSGRSVAALTDTGSMFSWAPFG